MSKKRKHLRREREVLRSLAASWLVLRVQRAEERSLTVSMLTTCCSLMSAEQDGGSRQLSQAAVESSGPPAAAALVSTLCHSEAPLLYYPLLTFLGNQDWDLIRRRSRLTSFCKNEDFSLADNLCNDDSGWRQSNNTLYEGACSVS